MLQCRYQIEKLQADGDGNFALTDRDFLELGQIVEHYYRGADIRQLLGHHLAQAGSVTLARQKGIIVGFAIASLHQTATPFSQKVLPTIYMRVVLLSPSCLFHNLGLVLLHSAVSTLLGKLWVLKRFVLVCRTQNPMVAKMFSKFRVYYPRPANELSPEVLAYMQSLLPLLEARVINPQGCLQNILPEYAGKDFSKVWHDFFSKKNNPYNLLFLQQVYSQQGEQIVNTGNGLLMLGYAHPLDFYRYFILLAGILPGKHK